MPVTKSKMRHLILLLLTYCRYIDDDVRIQNDRRGLHITIGIHLWLSLLVTMLPLLTHECTQRHTHKGIHIPVVQSTPDRIYRY